MARPRKEGASKSSIKRRKPDKYLDSKANADAVVPDLPDPAQWLDPSAEAWPRVVVNWWQDVHTSPMASEWHEADFAGLYLAATYLAGAVNPNLTPGERIKSALAWESSLKAFGLTPRSRELLRWKISQGEAAEKRTWELRGNRARGSVATAPGTQAVDDADAKTVELYSKYI